MKLKRLVAIFLVMTMTIGAAPSLVFADENDGTPNETKVVESSEPEEKKTVKPAETKPAETKPAETTVKETEKQAETSAAETTKPETTEPASTSETEKETPETTEPSEPRENAPAETNVEKPAKAAKGDETEPDDKEDGRQEVNFTGKSESYTYVPSGKADNEELFRKYIERKFSVSKSNTKDTARRSAKSALSGNGLTGNDKKAYDALKAQIVLVAEGSRTSTMLSVSLSDLGVPSEVVYTASQFGVESLVKDNSIIDELKAAIIASTNCNWQKVIDALLADCPYELYWYKKNANTTVSGLSYRCSGWADEITVTWNPTEYVIAFTVAAPYSAGDYQTDPDEIIRANTAISNAASIVSSAKNKSDYEKLVFYINEICKRVVYDKAAAQSGSSSINMDPWQLISVFDNNENTNVVCEGYAKSFKYLCDLTEFKNDISCILVVGTLQTPSVNGPHMWNLVTMEDGKNYLVDVTHCDAGSTGDPALMFLRGYSSGDVSNGYTCYIGSTPFKYIYDNENTAFSTSQLTISNKDYYMLSQPQITTWGELQAALKKGGNVTLTQDIVDTSCGGELVIPANVTTVLDLNGYVINRNGNQHLFWVEGNLTIEDSKPDRTHSPAISYSNPVTGDTVVVKGGVITGAFRGAIRGTYEGSITMNGGTVCGNTSDYNGGAVTLSGCVFNMYGGAIVNNSTKESGGAVHVYEGSSFNLFGGKISHNTAEKKAGGIYLYNNQSTPSILNMSGGEITGNVSASSGAGVNIDSRGRLYISGTAKIQDNKKGTAENNVQGEDQIFVSGTLKNGAKIGVTTYYDPTVSDPKKITTDGYKTYNNGEDPSKYFFSDKGFGVGLVTAGSAAGEVQLEFVIKTWSDLQTALNNGGTVKLTQDITAGAGDGTLTVTKTVTLDLNGYVINRNLKTATSNGGVILVDENGNLTINDSRPDAAHSPAIKYKDLTTGNDVVVDGGIITGGYNSGGVGGVYFKWATGVINGGTIVGNKACGADVFGNAGGIVIRSSTVTMNGGAVCGNEAIYGDGDTVAGGVMLNDLQGSTTIFNINGGLITGNYTNSADGSCLAGVFTYAGKINVSGKPQIYGNEKNGKDNNLVASNTTKGRVVDITGKLNDGARIGVTTWRIPPYWYGPDTFTYGFSTHNPGENPSKYFSLDDETAIMVFDDATEAKVALKFTLTITTDGNGTVTLDPADTDIYYGLYPTLSVTPKTGYVFKEWQVISGKATIDKDNKIFVDAEDPNNPVTDIQIKAVFERKKHNVTFVDGAKTLSTVAVVDGEKVTRPSDPVKDGFRFLGWYSDPEFDHPFVFDTAIGKETTIYASFVQEFTVKVTNGTAGMDKAIAGETVTVKADAAPSGYVFDKWTNVTATVSFADATATETSFDMPAGNVEVKATYKIVSGNCGENGDNVTWKIDYTTGTLTISGTGNMNNWADTDSVPWYPVKESIKSVVISDGVTSIGDSAFNGYSGITGITIPGTVTSIGNLAFSGCTSLTEVSYSGTKEQWNNISLGSGNDSLANATMQFAKSDNTLSVRGKTAKVKYSKLRRKKQTLTVGKVITFTNRGQGTLTYVKVSGSKKISISKTTGKVTIKKKGLKKRKTYSVKVRVMASGNENYKASSWKTITFKIKVK